MYLFIMLANSSHWSSQELVEKKITMFAGQVEIYFTVYYECLHKK